MENKRSDPIHDFDDVNIPKGKKLRPSMPELDNDIIVGVGDQQANLWLWFEPYLYETII
ncbi:hypothetical protein CASFOL_011486 [Castilleja foliolosa]|uniref:Uncharacterized protein n=1 Tax=Castilleja foliolosa TaxID=1961234 RepID=A0ABD3DX01_9LAMI